jgi:hypothetical protein
LIGYWRVAEDYQRFLYRLSGLFLVSAALHAAVFLLDDRPWEAPLSWRKPLLFSLSFALRLLLWRSPGSGRASR